MALGTLQTLEKCGELGAILPLKIGRLSVRLAGSCAPGRTGSKPPNFSRPTQICEDLKRAGRGRSTKPEWRAGFKCEE